MRKLQVVGEGFCPRFIKPSPQVTDSYEIRMERAFPQICFPKDLTESVTVWKCLI